MRIKKMGKEWGAAYIEAEPIEISHGDYTIQVYVTENHGIEILIPGAIEITRELTGSEYALCVRVE